MGSARPGVVSALLFAGLSSLSRAAPDPFADPDPRVRLEAVHLLGRSRISAGTATSLRRATTDPDPAVRAAAVEALDHAAEPVAPAPWLVSRFDDEAPAVRRAAVDAAARRRDATLLPHLILRLDDASLDVRAAAACALALISDERAVSPILRQLREKNVPLRVACIRALAILGARLAVPQLIDLAARGPETLRAEAVTALGRIGAHHARPPATRDDDRLVTEHIARSLVTYLDDPALGRIAAEALLAIGRATVPALVSRLSEGGDAGPIIDVLGGLADPRAVDAILDERSRGRVAPHRLARAFGVQRDPRVAPALAALLDTRDLATRRAAAASAAHVGSPVPAPLVHAFLAATRDPDGDLRRIATAVLAEFGARDATSGPAHRAARDARTAPARAAPRDASIGPAQRAPSEAATRLAELLSDPVPAVRAAAARGLIATDDPQAIASLLAAITAPNRAGDDPSLEDALSALCDSRCAPALRAAITRAPATASPPLIRLLGRLPRSPEDDPQSTALLVAAAEGGDRPHAEAALAALAFLPSPVAAACLSRIASDHAASAPRRRLAIQSLAGSAPTTSVTTVLAAALADPDPAIRAEAAWSVGQAGATASAALIAALADREPAVRANAVFALHHLASPVPVAADLVADPDPAVRANAVLALADAAIEQSEPRLSRLAAGDPSPLVRAAALRRLTRARALPAWVAASAHEDPSPLVRAVAAMPAPAPSPSLPAMHPIARSSEVAPLFAILRDPDGIALADTPYRLALPDGWIRCGRTDGSGSLFEIAVTPGSYEVELP